MNVIHDPDEILAAWLDEGPTRLPDATRRAIAVAARTTDQKRRSMWAPWRIVPMPMFARVAAVAIAVIAIAGGAVYFLGPNQGVGVPPPAALPTASSALTWTSYHSSRFAYTIDYPADWVATPATMDWPPTGFPSPMGGVDHDAFGPPSFGSPVYVASIPLKAGMAAADWLVALDGEGAAHDCHMSAARTIVVDGVDARRREGVCMTTDQMIEVAMADDKRFYLIYMFGTPAGAFTDVDHATLDKFLASFKFGG